MSLLNIIIDLLLSELEALLDHEHLDFGDIPFAEPVPLTAEEEGVLAEMEANAFDLWLCQNDW